MINIDRRLIFSTNQCCDEIQLPLDGAIEGDAILSLNITKEFSFKNSNRRFLYKATIFQRRFSILKS